MSREESFSLKVLIKQAPDAWVAHCLELDLVTEGATAEQVKADIVDIIIAHVRYALEYDNLPYMYHPAPPEVWREFLACADREQSSYRGAETSFQALIPIIQTDTCFSRQTCPA